jgi:hypothetical protein
VLINLVSNPEVSAEFRNQWMDYWAAVSEGREAPKVGPVELVGSEGLLNWFAQQGMSRAALAKMREGEKRKRARPEGEEGGGVATAVEHPGGGA